MAETLDPLACDRQEREQYLGERVAEALGDQGLLMLGGEEVMLLWDSLVQSFVEGNWIAVVLAGQAMCERGLAGIYSMQGLPRTQNLGRSNWEKAALGTLLKWARDDGLVPTATLDKMQMLCDRRKVLTHFKPPLDPGTIHRRAVEKVTSSEGAPWEDFHEVRDQLLAEDAMIAVEAVLDFCFGDQMLMVKLAPIATRGSSSEAESPTGSGAMPRS